MRFRKKPVVIEAIRYERPTPLTDWPDGWPLPEPSSPAAKTPLITICGELFVRTLEGDMHVELGDWIIRGVKGEFYPCKPDIFALTYEPAPTP